MPETNAGRIIAVILMLAGIGFVGMLTGTIANYFLSKNKHNNIHRNEVIERIQERLNDSKLLG